VHRPISRLTGLPYPIHPHGLQLVAFLADGAALWPKCPDREYQCRNFYATALNSMFRIACASEVMT